MYLYKLTKTILITYCLAVSISFSAHAAIVSGIVRDEKSNALPFVTVYIQNTTNTTSTDDNGKYTLELNPGNYNLVFQFAGYVKQVKTITVANNPVKLNVKLAPQQFNFSKPDLKPGDKDPAYTIIFNAQKKRSYYLNQVNSYLCDASIQNMWRLDSLSKRWLGFRIPIDIDSTEKDSSILGLIYLSESESQYNFKKPGNSKEIMYRSKVSGRRPAFSWNQVIDFKFNFYNNLVYDRDLGSRGFVSPLSISAMFYYDYKLLGTFFDGKLKVYKIQVIPKREQDPVFRGTIYIADSSWRIYSTDLLLTKNATLDFIDSLHIKQTFEPVNDTIWMPVSQLFTFRFSIPGLLRGGGTITGIFKNYRVDPVFPPHFFNDEELKVTEGENTKDTSYLSRFRLLTLPHHEKKKYIKQDSIEHIYDPAAYMDTLDKKKNRLKLLDLIVGYYYNNLHDDYRIHFSSPPYHIDFNTVEGFNFQQEITFQKMFSDSTSYSVSATGRYGFSDKLLSSKIDAQWVSDPVNLVSWSAGGGRFVEQVNYKNPINQGLNTYYSLLYRENYMKLYDNSYVYISHEREVINGLKLGATLTYSDRNPLFNTSNYSLAPAMPEYTPNTPQYLNGYADITHNTALLLNLTATIHFKQKYISYPHQKVVEGSKYPALIISYIEGIPAFGANANFKLLQAGLKGNYKFGLFGTSAFIINAGNFLGQKNLSFIDYVHFLGSQTIFSINYLAGFHLLPYYQYSTNAQYIEVHYEHHFDGFIFNKIPLVRRLKFQEVTGLHFLETPYIHYTEFTVGIEHILKFFRIDFVSSYNNTRHLNNGVTLGLTSLFSGN